MNKYMLKPVRLVFSNSHKGDCDVCNFEEYVMWDADTSRHICQNCNNIAYARACDKYIEHLEKVVTITKGEFNVKKPESMILEEPMFFMLREPVHELPARKWIKATILARYKFNRFIMLEDKSTIALNQNQILFLVPLDEFDEKVVQKARDKVIKEAFGDNVTMESLSSKEIMLVNKLASYKLDDIKGERL